MIGILTGAPGSVRGEQLAPGTEWFETEEGVRSLAVGNFDNRNGVDIVTASGENDSVTVFLNNGNGGFEEINYGTGTQPTSVVVGDVDNDNKQDIITSNWGNNSISVLNNSGLGIYPVNNEYSVGPNPTSVALGDLDGVNGPDIVATIGNDSIAIRYNDGAGGFGGQVDYYSVGGNPLSVRLGDLNGNGKLDIVTANRDDSDVTILINDGTGQFPLNFSMETAIRPNSVFLADINGDRNTDIITTGSSFVSVIRNNGVGFEERMDYMVGAKSSAVVAGDVDNDKDLDIITTNDNDHSVTILYNNGIGRFSKSIDYAVGTFPKDLVLTDLDADSDLDIITVNFCDRNYHPFGTPYVSMLMNNGMGSFGCGRRDYELDNRPNELIIDNLNSELYGLDVLISNGNKVALWDDNYVGILGNLSDVNAFNPITSLAVGDVDGINGKDIITLHKVQSKIKVMMNDGNRSFAFPINYSLNGSLDDMAFISDTERIVVVNTDDNNISVYTTVGGVIAGPTNVSTINGPESVYVGNLDKANNLDVVVYNSKRISVLLTDGAGDFLASTDYGFGLDELSLADIDDDGDDDIIGVLTNNDNLMIYLNVGLGVFNAVSSSSYAVGSQPVSVGVADLNGDNKLDVVTANEEDETVSILFNNGDGTLGSRTDYNVGGEPEKVSLGDFNFDSDIDIAALNTKTNEYSVSLLMNLGDGMFYQDSDKDGFSDDIDEFPIDPSEWLDSDSDGYGDFFDQLPWNRLEYVDQDGDYRGDTFSDVFPDDNTQWDDRDGDGFGDNRPGSTVTIRGIEYQVIYGDLFPENPLEWVDSDGDDIGDNSDPDDDNDGYDDSVEISEQKDPYNNSDTPDDLDGDYIPDSTDDDKDDDGYSNTQDAFPVDNTAWLDTDRDGWPDYNYFWQNGTYLNNDTDDDNDNWPDYGPDGEPGVAGVDDNGYDGVDDYWEMTWWGSDDDMFPLDKREWLDTDNDGIGNSADTDDDNDGSLDTQGAFPTNNSIWQDNDKDNWPDFFVSQNGTYVNDDPDDDGDNWPDFGQDGQPGVAGVDDDWWGGVDNYEEQGWWGRDYGDFNK